LFIRTIRKSKFSTENCGTKIAQVVFTVFFELADPFQRKMIKDFVFEASKPSSEKPKILVVDDEEIICSLLYDFLSESYECVTTESAENALELLEETEFDLLICDVNLKGASGIEVAKHAKARFPELVVVIISGKADVESAIEALRVGAFDYIKKPFDLENVELAVKRALGHRKLLVGRKLYEEHLKKLLENRGKQLDYLHYYDPQTSLPNRFLFEDRLMQAINQAEHEESSSNLLAVIIISLDQIKKIYSTWGAKLGDVVLREVATRIKECVESKGTVARVESDEFAICLPRIENEKQAVEIVERIKKALATPIIVEGEEVLVTISAGISIFPKDCKSAQEAMKNATVALNRAKESRQESWLFFTEELNEKLLKRLEMEMDLRKAIETEELELYFQPKVETATAKIIGAEALLRWNHKNGVIMPSDFIPLAEETGLIIPIGDWVLRNAFNQCKIWANKGYNLTVSVNLSPQQLKEKGFTEKVKSMIQEIGVDTKLLEIEVTETLLIEDPETAAEILNKLRNLGLKILIDDFGTGYSSLAYLRKLPIDGLKIDKSFIQDISSVNFSSSAELIVAIVNLAHNLRLKVIAEGVETEAQLKFLRFIRCDEAQGYLFGRPVLPGMFANYFKLA
jgi:diguanylate cyclase (GGDEF)-like protein